MIVKAQFRNQKKFIKIPEACFDLFIAEGELLIIMCIFLSLCIKLLIKHCLKLINLLLCSEREVLNTRRSCSYSYR